MLVCSERLTVNTEDFPAISIIRSIINLDKYSIVFQSKFNSDSNVSINNLEYNKAVEILGEITEGIINNKFYLKI